MIHPSETLYQGPIYFNHADGQKIKAHGTLNPSLKDFRFKFQGQEYYYLFQTKVSGSLRGDSSVEVQDFSIQVIRARANLLFLVTFRLRLMHTANTATYQVDGMLTA
jgi:hypothetical protein